MEPRPHAAIAAIVARIPLAGAVREYGDEFRSEVAAFGRLSGTSEDEAAALLDASGLLMQYVDRVGAVVTETYLAEHEELLRTLHALVAGRLDRGATSASLQVHRNTLTYRLGRIQAIAGLDLDAPRDVVHVYLASTTAT